MSTGDFEFLQSVDAFSTLSAPMLRQVETAFEARPYAAGERIVSRGEPGDAMYLVRAGTVRIPVVDSWGRQRLVAQLGPGEIFGEMALMTGDPRSADVYAETDVVTLVLPAREFQALVTNVPAIADFLTRILATRLAEGDMSQKRIGKYVLQREVGRGGMAVVFSASHAELHTQVAVKMLSHRLALDERFTNVFQREARIIAALRHPNIVQVYDTERAYATYFIVMEYVHGRPLDELIVEQGRLTADRVRWIVREVASALAYAHQKGVVHRDIKPSNVFVDDSGAVRLMDFGVAFTQQDGHTEGVTVGTPQYMAPEQCFGKPVDGRSDLYSLGITAFHMLTGEMPFTGDRPVEVMKAQIADPLPDLRALAADCPEDLVAWIERATQKAPEARFQTAAEAASALADSADRKGRRIKVLSLTYPAAEEARIHQALAEFQLTLAQSGGRIRVALTDLTPDLED